MVKNQHRPLRVRRVAELAAGVALLGTAATVAFANDAADPAQANLAIRVGAEVDDNSRPIDTNASAYRLQIPTLAVDAPIVAVDVDDKGVLGVPGDPAEIGWWAEGPIPGSGRGTSVLAGHVNTANRGPGALIGIEDLEPGDQIVIVGWDNTTTFEVESIEQYPRSDLPAEAFAQARTGRLALVSCGDLNESTGEYRNNVIVYALPT